MFTRTNFMQISPRVVPRHIRIYCQHSTQGVKHKFWHFCALLYHTSLGSGNYRRGAVQIQKSRTLKICPPSDLAYYVFVPPRILRTEIPPPHLRPQDINATH